MPKNAEALPVGSVRLDKWLWAARFFKTRQVAIDAIHAGRVDVNGERANASLSNCAKCRRRFSRGVPPSATGARSNASNDPPTRMGTDLSMFRECRTLL